MSRAAATTAGVPYRYGGPTEVHPTVQPSPVSSNLENTEDPQHEGAELCVIAAPLLAAGEVRAAPEQRFDTGGEDLPRIGGLAAAIDLAGVGIGPGILDGHLCPP